ncbi:MAG: peptide deformylase [Bryobacterales bacterium]|nr:peptide deformylase [Bryobacteraceae bacterium]MDW8353430.1 peptide deformylase [Bryobacterales bacterium]
MPARRILQLGDPLLRVVSEPVACPAHTHLLVRDLRATLRDFRARHGFGRGISAVQIGEPLRVIYIETTDFTGPLINPVLEQQSAETFRLWDECFSFPNLLVYLERSVTVRVRYQDLLGEWRTVEASAALSELLQHELDHLDGVLAVDRAIDRNSLATREEYERRYRGNAGPPSVGRNVF